MTKYYYARREKEEKGEILLEVPMFITPETTKENGQRVSMVKIGCRFYPCIYVWIPEWYYETYKRDIEQQAKEDERSARCLIPDPRNKGGRIRCPESNRCIDCPYVHKHNFDNGHDTSYDALLEVGYDAETGDEMDNDFDFESSSANPEDVIIGLDTLCQLNKILDTIGIQLAEYKPKYGAIFAELRKGVTNASEIARRCGLKPNRTAEDVRKVQAIAKKMYLNLK